MFVSNMALFPPVQNQQGNGSTAPRSTPPSCSCRLAREDLLWRCRYVSGNRITRWIAAVARRTVEQSGMYHAIARVQFHGSAFAGLRHRAADPHAHGVPFPLLSWHAQLTINSDKVCFHTSDSEFRNQSRHGHVAIASQYSHAASATLSECIPEASSDVAV